MNHLCPVTNKTKEIMGYLTMGNARYGYCPTCCQEFTPEDFGQAESEKVFAVIDKDKIVVCLNLIHDIATPEQIKKKYEEIHGEIENDETFYRDLRDLAQEGRIEKDGRGLYFSKTAEMTVKGGLE